MTQELWQSVLQMAVDDALVGNNEAGTGRETRIKATHRAREYLTQPNSDFNEVCTLAGLDPEAVRDAMRKRLAEAPSVDDVFNDTRRRNPMNQRRITHEGRTLRIDEWADETGLTKGAINTRLKLGWSVARSLTEPARRRGVRSNFTGNVGTGGGTRAQESTNITFQDQAT